MSKLNLPPLPPVDGEITGRSVVDVLTGRHRELVALADRLADPAEPRRDRLAQVVIAELSRHLSAEEQYLYPAVRAVVPDGHLITDRELAEDRELLLALQRLTGPDLDTSAAEVAAAVRRHAEADAAELLPLLTQMAPVEDLIRLGNRVELAEEAAPTRPHPHTPSAPPWNKVVDPVVAMVDKLRDVAGRRVTYPKDL